MKQIERDEAKLRFYRNETVYVADAFDMDIKYATDERLIPIRRRNRVDHFHIHMRQIKVATYGSPTSFWIEEEYRTPVMSKYVVDTDDIDDLQCAECGEPVDESTIEGAPVFCSRECESECAMATVELFGVYGRSKQ